MSTGAFGSYPENGCTDDSARSRAQSIADTVQPVADIIIVGSGISGTLAATAFARNGIKIILIDRHAIYPPDFRAEHLDGPMVDQLRRLGFLAGLTSGTCRGETVTIARKGRVVASVATINYGLRYEDLVNRARALLPPRLQKVVGRVAGIENSDTIQTVRLTDGRSFTSRLVVIATGPGYSLPKQLGIGRRIIREAHSLTFGFDIERTDGMPFRDTFVVYQREIIRQRIDYLAAFVIGQAMRVNLFTYRDFREPWAKAFIHDPTTCLKQAMPGLEAVMGPFRAVDPIVARPIDLYVSENYQKDGVVLIGDAFQTSCPATGMGLVRVLTDIEQLATVHATKWLASPGMGAHKIASFYDDPIKRACDAKALRDSAYRRAASTKTSLPWSLHRARVDLMQRLRIWLHRQPDHSLARVDPGRSEASLAAG